MPDTVILLLESNPNIRAALCDQLESAGYLVLTANDLGVAVDRISEVEPDLLIVAPYVSNMPGHIAADYLRSKCPGLPVLLVAGLPDDDRVRVENSIREFHIFPQPFHFDEFLAEVRAVIVASPKRA